MHPRKSNIGRHTHRTDALRRSIANATEEERASGNERTRQRMTQIRADGQAVRLEDASMLAGRYVLQFQIYFVLNRMK
ncbi:unnamed protein product, partial [Onchocerca ochengi]|uniref:DUF4258 domain-containing protein n=1 Tax=Onchocerca ochengi TaxID=42157 RepID=A0A182EZR3_ONCOC